MKKFILAIAMVLMMTGVGCAEETYKDESLQYKLVPVEEE